MLSYFHHIWLFATLGTAAYQDPLSMGFSRQEYWSGWCPLPGDLPDPGTELASLMSSALAGEFFTTNATWDAHQNLSVQSLSRVWLCNTPGLPVHHQLPESTQTHAHRVGDAIQPSHPLSSPSPPAPNPSQHQSLQNLSHVSNCCDFPTNKLDPLFCIINSFFP